MKRINFRIMTRYTVMAYAIALAMISAGCASGQPPAQTTQPEQTTAAQTAVQETGTETTAAGTTVSAAVRTKEELMEETKGKKVIALTFDDGPNLTTTNEILDIIEEYGIRASFFVIGQNINDDTAQVMKRAYSLGCEINSHSFTHSYMDKMTVEQITEEMDKTAKLIYDTIGEYPKFFRPPYIAVNSTMYDAIDLPFICGQGCNDWDDNTPVANRVRFVTQKCGDGCIVLLHDSKGNDKTVEALKEIVPAMLEDGYVFVTTSELFAAKGVTPDGYSEVMYSYATETGWKQ